MSKRSVSNEPDDFTQDQAMANAPGTVGLPVIELTLSQIKVDESKNLRKFDPGVQFIKELAASIKDVGLMNPLIVSPIAEPNGDGHTHELRAGFQRYKAIQHLIDGGEEIESVLVHVKDAEADSITLNLDENLRRKELSYMDAAYIAKELVDRGESQKAVAERFHKSQPWVTYLLKFLTLRPEIQRNIHLGKIGLRVARTLPDLTEGEQDALLARIEAGESGSDAAAEAKTKKGRKGAQGRKKKEDTSEGPKGISSKQAANLFQEMVDELKALEKPTDTDEKALKVYGVLVKFMAGGKGIKAVHNQIVEAIG